MSEHLVKTAKIGGVTYRVNQIIFFVPEPESVESILLDSNEHDIEFRLPDVYSLRVQACKNDQIAISQDGKKTEWLDKDGIRKMNIFISQAAAKAKCSRMLVDLLERIPGSIPDIVNLSKKTAKAVRDLETGQHPLLRYIMSHRDSIAGLSAKRVLEIREQCEMYLHAEIATLSM